MPGEPMLVPGAREITDYGLDAVLIVAIFKRSHDKFGKLCCFGKCRQVTLVQQPDSDPLILAKAGKDPLQQGAAGPVAVARRNLRLPTCIEDFFAAERRVGFELRQIEPPAVTALGTFAQAAERRERSGKAAYAEIGRASCR